MGRLLQSPNVRHLSSYQALPSRGDSPRRFLHDNDVQHQYSEESVSYRRNGIQSKSSEPNNF
eukprot:scaffold4834_cov117-Cylindrotheca_fusiformis.AAC.2